jgi:hypothetical protein
MWLIEERTASQWYEEAARCYVQSHQGCPRCGGQHCVLRSEWGSRIEYHCAACDFSACQDSKTGESFMDPGDGVGLAVSSRGEEVDEVSDTTVPGRELPTGRP